MQHEQIAGLHLFIRRRHAEQFLATHEAYHGQTERIPQATFDQVMLGKHRSRWNAHRQQLGTATGHCLQPIGCHEAQLRDKAQASQLLQRLPFPLKQQSLSSRKLMPPQILNLAFGWTVQRHHVNVMLPPQAALRQRGTQQRRPFGDRILRPHAGVEGADY